MIACWEAKYHYYFWRPNHAIQRADTDGNPATSPEPGWLPLITGNHPEYPSGHACFTAAVTESLRNYFGTKHVPLVDLQHGRRRDADVRESRRSRHRRRERPCLGRPPLPHDDDAVRQALHADRPRHRPAALPRRARCPTTAARSSAAERRGRRDGGWTSVHPPSWRSHAELPRRGLPAAVKGPRGGPPQQPGHVPRPRRCRAKAGRSAMSERRSCRTTRPASTSSKPPRPRS